MANTRDLSTEPESARLSSRVIAAISAATAIVYYFTNPKPQNFYDYTFRVAGNLLEGSIAFAEKPPGWLNEFVPFEGVWYSVFPFGAVVTMIPAVALKYLGLYKDMPGAAIAALSAGAVCLLLLSIANRYQVSSTRRIVTTMAVVFGTFMWTNLTFAGAWQLALGFAMVGELGAIYFTVFDRRPLLAGAFFALAFGNRTENLLTAPIFFYLLARADGHSSSDAGEASGDEKPAAKKSGNGDEGEAATGGARTVLGITLTADVFKRLAAFCSIPFILGILTLVYNYVRFHSFTDFGYARIPGVLSEPWYNHGIFSVYYIPRQAWEMLWRPWEWMNAAPYLKPNPFSSSILWSSPFLLLLLRFGSRDRMLKYASWAAIAVLTFLLWMHGNSGGWQFGYRYAMVLLPWVFVVLMENAAKKINPVEWALFVLSFAANIYATWLFHYTDHMK